MRRYQIAILLAFSAGVLAGDDALTRKCLAAQPWGTVGVQDTCPNTFQRFDQKLEPKGDLGGSAAGDLPPDHEKGEQAEAAYAKEGASGVFSRTATGHEGEQGQYRMDGSEYIIRFKQYKMQDEHRQNLAAAFEESLPESVWEWVERNNPAKRYPTDFGVLRVDEAALKAVQAAVALIPWVKDLTTQQKIFRSLSSESDSDAKAQRAKGRKRGRKAGPRAGGGASGKSAERAEVHSGPSAPRVDADLPWSPAVEKPPGRLRTKPTIGLDGDDSSLGPDDFGNASEHSRRQLLYSAGSKSITDAFSASTIWKKGFTGQKVKMAVFDTGVRLDHPHFKNIEERSNWTHENTLNDGLGHGTFVAGVIASQGNECQGFAPDALIHTFRVFTNDQVSYTSWFLDAFNYAIATDMNVINLSIGGPDYLDHPFVEKVWELTANNIIMVSAIGNDGPLYGTLNNPADQMDVIGVGGIDYTDHMASFSSRGMSTWELPAGYGRTKPDIVTYGRDVIGSKIQGGCRSLSGTSVASPVVAGAVVLLASTVPAEGRWDLLNPAVMKQALVEGATVINGPHIHEQGMGKLNLINSYNILKAYKPRASTVPGKWDLTNCPYMWPYCKTPLYAGAMPVILNTTVVNGMGLTGWIEGEPEWVAGQYGKLMDVRFEYSSSLWPWTGFLALYLRVKKEGEFFSGVVQGTVKFTVVSPPARGETRQRRSIVELPLKLNVIPTPSRRNRLLWDNYHSVRYPPSYLPRDSLDVRQDILDWNGDHPHTNYHDMFNHLRDAGYFVEMLGSPFTCFDAKNYAAVLLVDSEEEFHMEEVEKLHRDIEQEGLGLIVFADWYNVESMVKMRFFDDNTRSWWTPATGGSNVPALNDLLSKFGIAFGDSVISGQYQLGRHRISYASGTNIIRFPAGGYLYSFQMTERAAGQKGRGGNSRNSPALGMYKPKGKHGAIVVHGDSNCLDSSHIQMTSNCFWVLVKMIEYANSGNLDHSVFASSGLLNSPEGSPSMNHPRRRTDVDFTETSRVLKHDPVCGPDTPVEFQTGADPQMSAALVESPPSKNSFTQIQGWLPRSQCLRTPLARHSSQTAPARILSQSCIWTKAGSDLSQARDAPGGAPADGEGDKGPGVDLRPHTVPETNQKAHAPAKEPQPLPRELIEQDGMGAAQHVPSV
ncbi:Membrane-bound transcription factor site-1 protease, variant 2 [Cymbomonas tetramitiformis]|uniref:Membrane-bound transcription factor site-1 protease, variant 2 n=1 Tax=Cymbomonas tetramitiformis TaxID=36881 RepID=A0AAE0L3L5_9CHLO|nr:Membrane-bound transcription factor site-1 protease, variant 2 [Cymbomonas tetramitiformis]